MDMVVVRVRSGRVEYPGFPRSVVCQQGVASLRFGSLLPGMRGHHGRWAGGSEGFGELLGLPGTLSWVRKFAGPVLLGGVCRCDKNASDGVAR